MYCTGPDHHGNQEAISPSSWTQSSPGGVRVREQELNLFQTVSCVCLVSVLTPSADPVTNLCRRLSVPRSLAALCSSRLLTPPVDLLEFSPTTSTTCLQTNPMGESPWCSLFPTTSTSTLTGTRWGCLGWTSSVGNLCLKRCTTTQREASSGAKLKGPVWPTEGVRSPSEPPCQTVTSLSSRSRCAAAEMWSFFCSSCTSNPSFPNYTAPGFLFLFLLSFTLS